MADKTTPILTESDGVSPERLAQHKRGDRRDGVLLRQLRSMNLVMPYIMPHRADNEAFITLNADLRPIDAYLARKNEGRPQEDRYTYFHIVSAAIGKAFVLRPKMNRFIVNDRVYQRRDISIAFVVKKRFSDASEEGLAFLKYDADTTLDSYHAALMNIIHETRRTDVKDTSTDAMDVLVKLPHFILKPLVNFVLMLDRHGRAPESLIGTEPNHAAIFLSNLGSIGLECGYHHLVNWGTNSCFIVVGKKHPVMTYDEAGNGDLHMVLPLGITLDERIADGYYYSRTVALVRHLLACPEELEKPASTPVDY